MDLRQLKYFLTIVREGQITKAAKALNMEQPPLSRQLKQMEDELQVRLFDRNGKRLELTAAGMLLKERAEQLLIKFDETLLEVKESAGSMQGVLTIGSVVSCVSLLPGPIKQFRKVFPQVTFRIVEGDHPYLADKLEKRLVELVLARLPFESVSDPNQYKILKLPSDPYVAVAPSNWKLGQDKGAISVKELADAPLLTLKTERTTHMHEQVIHMCQHHGFEPSVIGECSSPAIIMSLVASGIGAAIIPKSVLNTFPTPAVKHLELYDAELQSEVGIVWMKHRYLSKSAQQFIEIFQAHSSQID